MAVKTKGSSQSIKIVFGKKKSGKLKKRYGPKDQSLTEAKADKL